MWRRVENVFTKITTTVFVHCFLNPPPSIWTVLCCFSVSPHSMQLTIRTAYLLLVAEFSNTVFHWVSCVSNCDLTFPAVMKSSWSVFFECPHVCIVSSKINDITTFHVSLTIARTICQPLGFYIARSEFFCSFALNVKGPVNSSPNVCKNNAASGIFRSVRYVREGLPFSQHKRLRTRKATFSERRAQKTFYFWPILWCSCPSVWYDHWRFARQGADSL